MPSHTQELWPGAQAVQQGSLVTQPLAILFQAVGR